MVVRTSGDERDRARLVELASACASAVAFMLLAIARDGVRDDASDWRSRSPSFLTLNRRRQWALVRDLPPTQIMQLPKTAVSPIWLPIVPQCVRWYERGGSMWALLDVMMVTACLIAWAGTPTVLLLMKLVSYAGAGNTRGAWGATVLLAIEGYFVREVLRAAFKMPAPLMLAPRDGSSTRMD